MGILADSSRICKDYLPGGQRMSIIGGYGFSPNTAALYLIKAGGSGQDDGIFTRPDRALLTGTPSTTNNKTVNAPPTVAKLISSLLPLKRLLNPSLGIERSVIFFKISNINTFNEY